MDLITKHSEVDAALELVRSELATEVDHIYEAGAQKLRQHKVELAKKAILFADELDGILGMLDGVESAWRKYLDKFDSASAELRGAMADLPTTPREGGIGSSRNVTAIAPWKGFKATFADGSVISERRCCDTFARVIDRLGAERVALLGVLAANEPLVTQDRSLYQKSPSSIKRIRGGWFVKPYGGTEYMVDLLGRIAQHLGEKIDFEIGRHPLAKKTSSELLKKASERSKARKKIGPDVSESLGAFVVSSNIWQYKIGKIAQVGFSMLFERKMLTREDIQFLLSHDSSEQFNNGNQATLIVFRGNPDELKNPVTGRTCFYAEKTIGRLQAYGERYALTNNFYPDTTAPVRSWLLKKGLTICEINAACHARFGDKGRIA